MRCALGGGELVPVAMLDSAEESVGAPGRDDDLYDENYDKW